MPRKDTSPSSGTATLVVPLDGPEFVNVVVTSVELTPPNKKDEIAPALQPFVVNDSDTFLARERDTDRRESSLG